MTTPSDIQVFCAAYELHFLRPFASVLGCSMIKKLDKVTSRKINISFVLLRNNILNLVMAHKFKNQKNAVH
jgi:hypothetical protein